jgi:hypothetical protein
VWINRLLSAPGYWFRNSRHLFHRHPGAGRDPGPAWIPACAGMTRIKFVGFGADNVRFGTPEQIFDQIGAGHCEEPEATKQSRAGSPMGTRLLRCARNDLCMSSGSAWSKFGLVAFVLLAGVGRLIIAAQAADDALISKGEYLARAGDCIACHTDPGGALFAGGRPMPPRSARSIRPTSPPITRPASDHGPRTSSTGPCTRAAFPMAGCSIRRCRSAPTRR